MVLTIILFQKIIRAQHPLKQGLKLITSGGTKKTGIYSCATSTKTRIETLEEGAASEAEYKDSCATSTKTRIKTKNPKST